MAFDRPTRSRTPVRAPAVSFDTARLAALLAQATEYAAYSGIGSRETPVDVLADMRLIGAALARRGYVLRSGGADGADLAFEETAPGRLAPGRERPREIYVPWKGFNLPPRLKASDDREFPPEGVDRLAQAVRDHERGLRNAPPSMTAAIAAEVAIRMRAQDIAADAHPAWERCSPGARGLHTRNVHQVLGMRLDSPVRFVVAWTVDGGPTGGTGQAIRIATALGIPVLNLHDRVLRAAILRELEIAR